MTLVNAHTHLELTWAGAHCPPPAGRPFTDWIYDLMFAWRDFRLAGGTPAAIDAGIAELHAAGVTHVGDISNTGLSIAPLLASGLAGVVYIEVIGIAREQGLTSFERARALLEKHRPAERNGMRLGLTPHAPYSTHPDAYRAVVDYAQKEDVPVCVHLAESPGEAEALLHGTGPFFDLATTIGVDPPPIPGVSPVAYLNDLGVLDCQPLLVHMVQVSDADLDLVATAGARVAHCPRSNERLQCGRMPLEKMLARGIPVALGSDSRGSSPSLDPREEADRARDWHGTRVPAAVYSELLANSAIFGNHD